MQTPDVDSSYAPLTRLELQENGQKPGAALAKKLPIGSARISALTAALIQRSLRTPRLWSAPAPPDRTEDRHAGPRVDIEYRSAPARGASVNHDKSIANQNVSRSPT